MSKDNPEQPLRNFIPFSARNAPSQKSTFNLRVPNIQKLDDITDEYGATKSGIVNALIAREHERMFEQEEA